MTEGVASKEAERTAKRQIPSCPCCVFLNQDLFLPSSMSSALADATNNDSSSSTSEVVSPQEALQCIADHARQLQQQQQPSEGSTATPTKPPILLVDTHNHAHLTRERHPAYCQQSPEQYSSNSNNINDLSVVSVTLAVEPDDWKEALQYSANDGTTDTVESRQPRRDADATLMGFGIHPWYLAGVEPDGPWLERLEQLLQEHPSGLVGEIGLCKLAKCARTHPDGKARGFAVQRQVLQAQLDLATKYRRPVSIHCVQQHGVLLEMLQEITSKHQPDVDKGLLPSFLVPPTMAMHSFTGTAHHVKILLQWETTLFGEGPNDRRRKKKKEQQQQETPRQSPPLLYFGFSHIVNYDMCTSEKARRQGRDTVRAVPFNRLLAESDVHHPADVPAGTAGAIAYLAWALERSIPDVAEITAQNGLCFLQSHLQ